MQFVFLLGGFVGFVLTAGTGFLVGRNPSLVLRDSMIGCLIGAMLFRWFWSVVTKALAETVAAKRAAALAAAEAAAAAPQSPTRPAPVPAGTRPNS